MPFSAARRALTRRREREELPVGADLDAQSDLTRRRDRDATRLRAEQGQFLGHPNPNALRSSNIQHPIYRRKGTLRSGVSPMGFGV